MHPIFKGRTAGIATMHGKEEVLAPLLKGSAGIISITNPKINTDVLGTFTKEVERTDSVIDTLRNKCKMMALSDQLDLVVASEGSFGPHPFIPFAKANEEIIMLKDYKNNLEIIGKHLTSETNFHSDEIHSADELNAFAKKVGFPEHGIILRDRNSIFKNILTQNDLSNTFEILYKQDVGVKAETDMRAHKNPLRMKAIEMAGMNLISNMQSTCPECDTPGFVVQEIKSGLPCELCFSPTKTTLSHIRICSKCQYSTEEKFPHGKTVEQAQFCDSCNP